MLFDMLQTLAGISGDTVSEHSPNRSGQSTKFAFTPYSVGESKKCLINKNCIHFILPFDLLFWLSHL